MINIEEAVNKAGNIRTADIIGSSMCNRCCEVLKKVKGSIINYKDYLEAEAQEVEKLYAKHKKTLFVSKT